MKLAAANRGLQEANAQLAFNEEKFRIALSYMKQMVYEFDIATGTIRRTNGEQSEDGKVPVYENMPEGLIQSAQIPPDSAEVIREMYQQIIAGKPFDSGVVQLPKKDGSYVWSKISYITIFDKDGAPIKAIGIVEDIDDAKREEHDLREKAMRDMPTGLYNKTTTQWLIEDILQRDNKRKHCHALLLLDIDNFKEVNDTYGHAAGDTFLEIVAQKMKRVVRKTDIVGRMGGDEFAVFLQNVENPAAAEVKAMEILNVLRQPMTQRQIIATASIGISLSPEHGTMFSELYLRADKAMYRAKEKSKNTYVVFSM